MPAENIRTPEQVNYRTIKNDAGCIHCRLCDWDKMQVIDGIYTSECMVLKIKVDENHLCDLIC